MCQTNDKFYTQFPERKKLYVHPLFKNQELKVTPLLLQQICTLIHKEEKTIDEIYESQIQERNQAQQLETTMKTNEDRENKMSLFIYRRLQDIYPKEINLINILSFAPAGLLPFDITRLVFLNNQQRSQRIEYGNE